MQGTQSSMIPDMTEGRSHASRQRVNEAVLAAMDAEEAGDGRPAWLRHWSGERPRPSVFERGAATLSELRRDEPSAAEKPADALHGYPGQSIEAAFSYEAVFHFDTELEAEATEDWLDLSTGREDEDLGEATSPAGREMEEHLPGIDASHSQADGQDLQRIAPEDEMTMLDANRGLADRVGQDATADRPRASATSPDPKAVRAAIFRLAQDSSNRWLSGEPQVKGLQELPPAELKSEGLEVCGAEEVMPFSQIAPTDFAEVARRLWSKTESSRVAEAGNEMQPERSERSGQLEPVASVSFLAEAKLEERKEEREQPEVLQESRPAVESSEAAAIAVASPALDAAGTAHQETISTPPAGPGSQSLVEESTTASGAPALAHDAGNLLSALKLYSELLALSGVLQARHSHYAEDLKLLAARSEVLIHRLLQSFRLAEEEHPGLEVRELSSEPAVPGTQIAVQQSQDTGSHPEPEESSLVKVTEPADQGAASISFGLETERPEVMRLHSDDPGATQQTARYWTDERLSAIHQTTGEDAGEAVNAAQEADLGTGLGTGLGASLGANAVRAAVSEPKGSSEPLNLVELLRRWGGLLSMIARGPVKVNFGPHAALPLQIPEEALERILVNLVHNAMTATRDGGSIRIGVGRAETRRPPLAATAWGESQPANRMVLTVDDSGCGMSEQQVARLLGDDGRKDDVRQTEPRSTDPELGLDLNAALHRVSNQASPGSTPAASKQRGYGMGLQIVRELVASSGGELAIYSRRGAGTRIEIQWPIRPWPIEDTVSPQRIPPASTGNFSPNSTSQGSIRGNHGNLEGAIAC